MCMSTFPTEVKTRFYLIYFRLCLFPLLFSALKPGFKKSYRKVELKSWCSNSKYQAVKVHSAEVFLWNLLSDVRSFLVSVVVFLHS